MRRVVLALVLALAAGSASAGEPEAVPFRKLPGPLQALHAGCARPGDTVYYAAGDFGPLTVFRVSCPRGLARSWPKSLAPLFDVTLAVGFPVAFYVARDREGTGARRLRFPVLLENGKRRLVTTLPIGAEADRDRTAAPGTSPPWIDAQWKPAARPDICKISAVWRIAGRRAELRRWRVAPKCNLGGPVYEIRLDRGVPDLVGN